MRELTTHFIVTTGTSGCSKSQIWNSSQPLPLGHPFQWVIERTESGLRVRNLSGTPNQLEKNGVKDLPFEKLGEETEIELPRLASARTEPFFLKIRPAQFLRPGFEGRSGSAVTVFKCLHPTTIAESAALDVPGLRYTASLHRRPVFEIDRTGTTYRLSFKLDGLTVKTRGQTQTPKLGESLELAAEELSRTTITIDTVTWRFGMADAAAAAIPENGDRPFDPEAAEFKKMLGISAIFLVVLAMLSVIWPKPNHQDELIPPQFTKILLTPPKTAPAPVGNPDKVEVTKATKEADKAITNAPKKVQQTAVVQAFRAKALQNSISGLLKGGMTRLLAQSDFVMGNQATKEAKRIFNTTSDALRPTGPNVGMATDRNVKVASIGGEAGAGGSHAVGYGKGKHAGVSGQGQSFVTMDVADSSVEEGLTKDEVGEVIHRHMSEIRYCYESSMIRTPDLEGKLIINFTIGAPGTVKSSEIKSSTLSDPRLDDCVLRRLVTWKFPQTKGGVDVAVSYPFIFKTLGR